MTPALDRAAEALLSAAVDEAGDLIGAFTRLCAGASMGDVEGETYRAALERMVRGHFGQPRGRPPNPASQSAKRAGEA